MALQGLVLLTSSSEEGPYRSANHLNLLLIIDIFIHCNKQDESSRVMVGSADL